jgi:(E)-4-hydroxy-3-methylbut-2-enyl-diphosphate synthase
MQSPNKDVRYCENLFQFTRRPSSEVTIGNLKMGAAHPVKLQSMTTTNTLDTQSTVEQSIRIIREGGELVRITTQGRREARNLENIHQQLREQGYTTPLVADIHFNPNAAEIAATIVEKVRINPGNFVDGAKKFREHDTSDEAWLEGIEQIKEKLVPFLNICKTHNTAIRIGTNHGSLSDRIMSRYGDTPEGMVESCMEYLRICRDENFHQIVLSIKASNTRIMVHTVRLLVAKMKDENMYYPLHLGVTEAGNGEDGRIKSAVGIGALLADGIGDTIRVSLTEDPEKEIPVARLLANHFEGLINHAPVKPCEPFNFTPFQYNRLKTKSVLNIGNLHQPIVIQSIDEQSCIILNQNDKPDYIFCRDKSMVEKHQAKHAIICPFDVSKTIASKTNVYPLININEIESIDESQTVFIKISLSDINPEAISQLKAKPNSIIVATSTHINSLGEYRSIIWQLQQAGIQQPVILNRTYTESQSDAMQIKSGAELGILFLDGMADGLWVENTHLDQSQLLSIQFGILQASRVRFSKTEYISCPGCGRTLFALQEITKAIKERTSHLKGLKIGIMGCIVNGIGEMADADYGYVGSGPGKVSLFKQKELIKRNIPTQEALDELILLIKEHGDWIEP